MANEIKPVHLLLLEPSSNDAEKLITTLRNHGYPVRATQVVKEDLLIEHLAKQSWDLCFSRAELNGLNVSRVIELINEYGRDIPVILVTDEDNESTLISALQAGIKDSVPFKSQERMYLVAKRELENLDQRKLRKRAELQLAETEKRCNLLLDSSQDAIAYIHEGMHIYANQAYVELFGFEDADELLCMPVMDMISPQNHETFKSFLRHYAKKPSSNNFACQGVKSDMSEFEVILTLTNAAYDNEECTQVLIKSTSDSEELEAKVRELSAQDVLTGLYNEAYFQEKLDEIVDAGSESGQNHHLLFIQLDQFSAVEKEFGIAGTDDAIRETAGWLQSQIAEGELLGRFGSDAYMLLLEQPSPEVAKSFAEQLCSTIRDHLFEVDGRTQKFTFSIGIAPVGDQANNARELISDAHSACQRAHGKTGDAVKMFSRMIDQEHSEHSEMIERIHDAIENNKFHLVFQPVVKLHGDERPLYQSLLRMTTENGDVAPTEILPIAEVSGLAAKLDRWVIMHSMKQLHAQKVKASLFVHLSSAALTDEGLVKFIVDLFKSSKLPTSSIILTVSANDALTYLKRVILLNNTLKKARIQLAISQIENTQEHYTLLDQLLPAFAIVNGDITMALSSGGDSVSDITEILTQAHQRDILSVAPKVEDAACLAALWPLGISYIQGYYLQEPMRKLAFDFSSSDF